MLYSKYGVLVFNRCVPLFLAYLVQFSIINNSSTRRLTTAQEMIFVLFDSSVIVPSNHLYPLREAEPALCYPDSSRIETKDHTTVGFPTLALPSYCSCCLVEDTLVAHQQLLYYRVIARGVHPMASQHSIQ